LSTDRLQEAASRIRHRSRRLCLPAINASIATSSAWQHARIRPRRRILDFDRPGDATKELRRADRARDSVGVANAPHFVPAGAQQRRTDTGAALRRCHADRANETARSGVVAAEPDGLVLAQRDVQADRAIAQRHPRSLAHPAENSRAIQSTTGSFSGPSGLRASARTAVEPAWSDGNAYSPDQHVHGSCVGR
jgi:hypothetical protein